jgi:WD40 repeat protein/predicted Ser/Thr protein kinase
MPRGENAVMTHGDLDRIEEIFSAALERPPQNRIAFVRQACGGDAALETRVQSLLDAHEKAGEVLPAPPEVIGDLDESAPDAAGQRLGQYTIRRTIASGGMGIVYEAEQDHPRRTVALKVLRRGIASRQAMRRFGHEVEILGRLQHPNIAQIYDAGTFDEGEGAQPYFAMEYIHGRPLIEGANAEKLGIRERLALLVKICKAVWHAHQQGVIHRDLKPDNILIDDQGEPKILDFGIARATDSDIQTTTLQTDMGQLIGTVPYMSPEQVAGDPHKLDTRSDVYSLGVLLYELLSDRLPHDLKDRTIPEAVRIIGEDDPTPLSSISRTFRGDLDTIVSKALEKEKDRRYQSAAELAADVRHYLSDEPIVARPPSMFYQLGKFARRNKGLVAGIAVAIAALLLGSVLATWQAIHATRLEREARWPSYIANIGAAQGSLAAGEIGSARRRLEEAPEEHRSWEWRHLRESLDQSVAVLGGHEGRVWTVAFDPDGERLAAGSNGPVYLWDVGTGDLLRRLIGHTGGVTSVAFSPDGTRLASASWDATIRVWDVNSGAELRKLEGHRFGIGIRCLAFSPDGLRLVSGATVKEKSAAPARTDLEPAPAPGRCIRVWDVATGEELVTMAAGPDVKAVAYSLDGSTIVSGHADGALRFWDAASGEQRAESSGLGPIYTIAFGPHGDDLVTLNWDEGRLTRRSAQDGAVLVSHDLHLPDVAMSPCYDPGGTWLALGSRDGTVRRVDPRTGALIETFHGHERWVCAVAVAPDGRLIASGSYDGTVRLWVPGSSRRSEILRGPTHTGCFAALDFSPDGTRLAGAVMSGYCVTVWDVGEGRRIATFLPPAATLNGVAFSPDGSCLVSMLRDETMIGWDTTTGETLWIAEEDVEERRGWNSIDFSPDGRFVACGAWGGDAPIRDAATGQLVTRAPGEGSQVLSVAFSPDGKRIATSRWGAPVMVWDLDSRRLIHTLRVPGSPLTYRVAFSPDGSMIAASGWDGTIRRWDAETGEEQPRLQGHADQVYDIAFSPDGRRLASASGGKAVRVWDVATGDEVAAFRDFPEGTSGEVWGIAFSPDGTRLAIGIANGTVRLCDSVPRAQRFEEREALRAAEPEARRVLEAALSASSDYALAAERIRKDADLSEPVRRVALNRLLSRAVAEREPVGVSPLIVNVNAWYVVSVPDETPESYARALRWATAAARAVPDEGNYLNTLGVAQFRCGMYEEAIETLLRSDALYVETGGGEQPASAAFIAMAHYRLGRTERARAELDRARGLMDDTQATTHEENQAFLREAEALIEGEARPPPSAE